MAGLVFDLGGTHLRAAVATSDGRLVNTTKERLPSLAVGVNPREVWRTVNERLATYLARNIHHTPPQSPIVISFPGPISDTGMPLQAPTLTGADPDLPDFRTQLGALSGRSVYLLNDLSAAAWYLSGFTPGRFLVVTISSGIGSKLFDPAIGVLDDVPFAGEIGHSVADNSPHAVQCDCGGRGHLGAIASGRGIERLARLGALAEPARFAESQCAHRYGASPSTLTNEDHLVPAFRNGDPWATQIIGHATHYLARSLVHSIIVAGLRSVVIIGGFALCAGEAYLAVLRSAARECCDYELLRQSIGQRLTLGEIGDEACLLGAAVYARRVSQS
jgi:glucokinase